MTRCMYSDTRALVQHAPKCGHLSEGLADDAEWSNHSGSPPALDAMVW